MSDIDLAREILMQGFSLVVVKDGECLFKERGTWIHPIVHAFEKLGDTMHGASVADSIMGKAAAVLCIMGKVRSVYTPAISLPALKMLSREHIQVQYERTVPGIMNRDRSDFCLAEKIMMDVDDPEKAFSALWKLLQKD